ncbi:hypothetical protein [Rhizobium tumorigenes]|uniref:hypothetical protein n=1 Tax=Rhizobium tumorigenes TaxID=2041385 RepID=UPI00241E9D79|nr:hypothetical protein [Rhizobium tumorigenes]WFS02205.1 hypothetical protein PR016_06220 [Rhizobium tumorigenes]
MVDDNRQNQGLSEAHTLAENSARAAQIADLVQPEAEPEQQSLLLDDLDDQCIFKGPVKHVAEQLADHRRGRGRPAGSTNKANQRFRDVVMRMGYRHPGLNLAALANADPAELSEQLSHVEADKHGVKWNVGCTRLEAMQLILKANAELLPYFESKAPTEVHVDKTLRGVMIIGEMKTDGEIASAVMDLTSFPDPE